MIIKLKFKDTPAGQETIFPEVNGATLKADTDLDLTDWTLSSPTWETEAEATFTSTKNKADFSQPDINNRLILEGVINRHHTAPASTGGGGASSDPFKGWYTTHNNIFIPISGYRIYKYDSNYLHVGNDNADISLVYVHSSQFEDALKKLIKYLQDNPNITEIPENTDISAGHSVRYKLIKLF